ncbi:hypothetical protein SLEP1_g46852 [Rubroshorea leprosula]|uniref:CASP-like protein n=1 Tax=Rubroshorea leprosula TaxID=152421 RepID=A0AAV5LPE2_9ROSI|nr:hypothetical protein SLEP1_g46852 [Rubroshorea leprosula]
METQKSNIVAKQGMTTSLFLRFMAFVLTLAAAILMGVNNQTKVVSLQTISTSLPALNIPVQAKWHYLSALVYSFVTDVIASSYAAISFLLLIANRDRRKGLGLLLTIFDLAMVALLLSSCGAAGAVGLLAYTGNSHVKWNKVCNIIDRFCRQGAVSVAFSLLGSLAFLFHIVVAVLSLYNGSDSE